MATAYEEGLVCRTKVAAADLRTKQFYAVKLDATGKVVLAGLGEAVYGILQNAPNTGELASVAVSGVSKFVAGGAVATTDLLKSSAAGKLIPAAKATVNTSDAGAASDPVIGSYVLGFAVVAAAGDLSVGSVEIVHAGGVPTTAA